MDKRDFFSYCTTLKPVELRSLGQLSQTRHLEEGDILYRAGEAADAIYIVSRGVVEMLWDSEAPGADAHSEPDQRCYLSRGDMVGAVAVLTESPHANEVRACESSSLQCIPKENLASLASKVPSFMQYVAEQLSHQLAQVNELNAIQSNCLELSGNLANFDLVTVFQTILQSNQTGELVISDEQDTPVGRFLFKNGHPKAGQLAHLTGEEALWQLFLRETPGTFSFARITEENWRDADMTCTRPADDFLLNALQMRDEFQALLEKMPSADATLVPCQNDVSAEEIGLRHRLHVAIWNTLQKESISLESLLSRLPYNEFTFYQGLSQLLEAGYLKSCETPLATVFNLSRRSPMHMRAIPNTHRVVRQSPVPV